MACSKWWLGYVVRQGGVGPVVVAETAPSVGQVPAVFDDSKRVPMLRGEIVSKACKEQETSTVTLAMPLVLWEPGNF